MKQPLLLIALQLLLFSNFISAQSKADDDSMNRPDSNHEQNNVPINFTKSISNGVYTIDGEILPCDATSTTLSVSGACYYNWYTDSLQTNIVGANSDLIVSPIMNDTTIYFASMVPDNLVVTPMPSQTSTFSNDVRGYWFQAPSDMYVSKIFIPTTASTGNQSVAILKLNSGPPPVYGSVTNDFTTLGLWQDVSLDTIATCIYIQAGDYIGVLGSRAGVSSYAPGGTTLIHGTSVNIARLGMQFPLATNAPQDLWTETNGSISRVELFYGSSMIVDEIVPVSIIVPQPYTSTTTINYCLGDSVLAGGIYYSADTTFSDSLLTAAGCDSVLTTIISAVPANMTVHQSGIVLTSNEAGASYQWIDCTTGIPVVGEIGVSFTPSANGNYAVIVTSNGCSDTSNCILINSVGLDELNGEFGLKVYPNPTQSELTYTFKGEQSLTYKILDLNGKLLQNGRMIANQGKIDVSRLASGTYLLEVSSTSQKRTIRLVKD